MTVFHLPIVAGSIGVDELVSNSQFTGPDSKRVWRSRWLLKKQPIYSKPLSVWTHSTVMPSREKCVTTMFKKSVPVKGLCSS